MTINVTSENLGLYTEAFNITAYANSTTTTIGTEEVTLASKDSTSTIFTWNTTGLEIGNYTISAYAIPVSGELSIDDNNMTDGIVLVTIAGDITGDRSVDIYDLAKAGQSFASYTGELRYSSEADITNDGHVDMRDVIVIGRNYGKTCLVTVYVEPANPDVVGPYIIWIKDGLDNTVAGPSLSDGSGDFTACLEDGPYIAWAQPAAGPCMFLGKVFFMPTLSVTITECT